MMSAGPYRSKLQFNAGQFQVGLALCVLLCFGLAGCHKTHNVTLTWQAAPVTSGPPVTGYNVYRSGTSGRQFVKIASRIPEPVYEDRQVPGGRTYFYVVTAVDQVGHESRFSAEVRVEIR
jgi:fibronectin type 3 domain-containing protein